MTRRKPCEMPITRIASSSSVTRMTPSCAVIEEPERPATRIAASIGPSSRIDAHAEDVDDVDVGAELRSCCDDR